jgi:hypothetical protein
MGHRVASTTDFYMRACVRSLYTYMHCTHALVGVFLKEISQQLVQAFRGHRNLHGILDIYIVCPCVRVMRTCVRSHIIVRIRSKIGGTLFSMGYILFTCGLAWAVCTRAFAHFRRVRSKLCGNICMVHKLHGIRE